MSQAYIWMHIYMISMLLVLLFLNTSLYLQGITLPLVKAFFL